MHTAICGEANNRFIRPFAENVPKTKTVKTYVLGLQTGVGKSFQLAVNGKAYQIFPTFLGHNKKYLCGDQQDQVKWGQVKWSAMIGRGHATFTDGQI